MKHLLSLIPLILLPILIVSSHVPLVFGRCREDQQSLLLQLKHDLNFEVSDSQKSVWWNASTDCCEWPGISCDPGGLGRVIGFHLNNEGITRGGGGGLNNSTALFSLRYLEYLDLSHNKFNTTIPAALGNLTNLRYLDLSHADFFGPIPASISQNLKVLSLSDCSLSGPIDLSLSKLQSLSRLELDYNNFSSPIPNSLAEGKNLTYLSMRNCGLIGTFSKKIAQSLTLLETLRLSFNQLQGPIPRSIFELPSLRVLSLSHNRFRGSVQLSWIQTLQNLTYLNLSYNNLTVDASTNNSSPSSTFPQLERLYLRSCSLRTFPEFGNQSQLTELDLSDNNINGVVPRWIMESTTLISLNLSHNNLVGLDVHRFSYVFLLLDMHDNQLEGNFPFIPSPISSTKVGAYIDFSHNHLNGSFPTQYFNNQYTRLTFLSLSNNSLTGIIPTSICNLVDLKVVDFSNNYFNGTIPSCLLKDLRSLYVLDLRGNMLSGKIPDTFRASSALQTLDLSNNQLQGRIPESLENCNKLEVLDIGNNKISDVFPCIRGIKSSLRVLILRNNLFHGNIWCSSNNFDGPIPEVMGKFKALQVLNLSHNAFSSQIPSGFGNLSNVESLDLSHNKLTGKIPNELAGLTFLSCMDLSDNYLVGRIPTGTQFQSFDNTSFGGNPDLCGQPLSKSCTDPPAPQNIIVNNGKSSVGIDWDILSKVFGFFCGLGLIMLPASLWPSFRIWFWPKIDYVILWMFPKLYTKDWNNRLRARKTRLRNKQRKAIQ
ncbi:Receptor-like protein 12 [Linum perenne]